MKESLRVKCTGMGRIKILLPFGGSAQTKIYLSLTLFLQMFSFFYVVISFTKWTDHKAFTNCTLAVRHSLINALSEYLYVKISPLEAISEISRTPPWIARCSILQRSCLRRSNRSCYSLWGVLANHDGNRDESVPKQ